MSLAGKVAVITGAAGALGSAVTRGFLEAGATVAGVSRSIQDSDFKSERFFAVPAEISSVKAAQAAVAHVIERAGKVDILAHLIGGFAGGVSVADSDDAMLSQMLEVNLASAFYMVKAALGPMRERRSGRIVVVGSRAAVEASPNAGIYSAAKAGLIALMRAVAAENGPLGITANAVLPGTLDTPANRSWMSGADFSKLVQPEQVARLIVALSSDDLSQVNGAAIPIYGEGS